MNENLLNSHAQQERYRFNGLIPLYNSTLSKPSFPEKKPYGKFTDYYRLRLSTVWCPERKAKREPPLIIQCHKIYYRHIGMLPNYGGHVPGDKFRYGETYGSGSKNSKKWLKQN